MLLSLWGIAARFSLQSSLLLLLELFISLCVWSSWVSDVKSQSFLCLCCSSCHVKVCHLQVQVLVLCYVVHLIMEMTDNKNEISCMWEHHSINTFTYVLSHHLAGQKSGRGANENKCKRLLQMKI